MRRQLDVEAALGCGGAEAGALAARHEDGGNLAGGDGAEAVGVPGEALRGRGGEEGDDGGEGGEGGGGGGRCGGFGLVLEDGAVVGGGGGGVDVAGVGEQLGALAVVELGPEVEDVSLAGGLVGGEQVGGEKGWTWRGAGEAWHGGDGGGGREGGGGTQLSG